MPHSIQALLPLFENASINIWFRQMKQLLPQKHHICITLPNYMNSTICTSLAFGFLWSVWPVTFSIKLYFLRQTQFFLRHIWYLDLCSQMYVTTEHEPFCFNGHVTQLSFTVQVAAPLFLTTARQSRQSISCALWYNMLQTMGCENTGSYNGVSDRPYNKPICV